MAKWLKTKAPHALFEHTDIDPAREIGQLVVWQGLLYKHLDPYEATKPKQIDYRAPNAGDTLNIDLEHPNTSRDRIVQIYRFQGATNKLVTLYDFTPEERDLFNVTSDFTIMDGTLRLRTEDDLNMSPDQFFWWAEIDLTKYADIYMLNVITTV